MLADIHMYALRIFFLNKGPSTAPNTLPKVPEPRFPYPRTSDLTIEDQKYFLDAYNEYTSENEVGTENLSRLQVLKRKAYRLFLHFTKAIDLIKHNKILENMKTMVLGTHSYHGLHYISTIESWEQSYAI